MQNNVGNSPLPDQAKAPTGSMAVEAKALEEDQHPLINRILIERTRLEALLQAETERLLETRLALERAMDQVAVLENRLRQRGEENDQAWAAVAANEAELAALRLGAARSQMALDEANAWVFRLAGERRSLEQDEARRQRHDQLAQAKIVRLTAELLNMERELARREDGQRALLADLDHVRQRLKSRQVADSEALGQALARDIEFAEKTGLLRAREAELALLRDDHARLAHESRQLRQRHDQAIAQVRSDLDGARRSLGEFEHEKTERTRDGDLALRKLDWLVELKMAEARYGFWWRFLPGPAQRWLQYRSLARDAIFDANAYRARHPDVAAARMDPLEHFIRHGLHEERLPF